MAAQRSVFIVGHAHWGKSRTLRALTEGNRYQRYIRLSEVEFFIRRMSNDDRPKKYYKFIRDLQPSSISNLIASFCPEFSDPRVRECLENLRSKNYALFFWVLRQKYTNGRFVTPEEITTLREYGMVEVYDSRGIEDHVRARELRSFIGDRVVG